MPILGAIVRTTPPAVAAVRERLAARAGVDISLDLGDGRLILVIEDSAQAAAAASLAEIAGWPEVLNTSLVYEYCGPDAPGAQAEFTAYADWRDGLGRLGRSDACSPT